jgi:hypothetical protein
MSVSRNAIIKGITIVEKTIDRVIPPRGDNALQSKVINDPKTSTSTVFKTPGTTPSRTTSEPLSQLHKFLFGDPPIPDVTPKTAKSIDQTAMPDMDDFVAQEKPKVAKIPSIPQNTGTSRANTPVGSMPFSKINSVPSNTGVGKADTPVGSMPKSSVYTVQPGDNLTNILKSNGIAPTPANIKKLARLNGIKNANKIMPGKKLKLDIKADENVKMPSISTIKPTGPQSVAGQAANPLMLKQLQQQKMN